MRQSLNKSSILLALAYLLALASVAHSTPIQLEYNDIRFPISVNFPAEPQSVRTPNSALAGSYIYYFVYKNTTSSLTFAVFCIPIPQRAGTISAGIAHMMVTEALNNQIANTDNALGVHGEVTNEPSDIPKIYTSKTYEVWRLTKPPQFGRYTSFMVDRLLIIVFASGISSRKNRDSVRNFVNSVVVKK
jgi:hypothetical protein